MKKIVFTFAIALMSLSATYAQRTNRQQLSPEQRAEKSTAKLEKELGLKPDQKQKVYALELDKFREQANRFEKAKAERTKERAEMLKLRNQNVAQLNKVLTAEQLTKLEALQKDKKRGSHEMRQGRKRGMRDSTRIGRRDGIRKEQMKAQSMRRDSTLKR